MADLSLTLSAIVNDLANDATPVNQAFQDIVTYINARNQGTTDWDAIDATTLSFNGLNISQVLHYKKPNLVYISATAVDVEVNSATANTTEILFPDFNFRSVTEDTSSTHKYRRFTITAAAEFTTGTEDSGLRATETEATDTWYAIYAVKSTIDSTKFVLVGSTTLPVQGSIANLNTYFGTNGWVYLGMIRNGDNSGTTGDILAFRQTGNRTSFYNTCTASGAASPGIRLANTASATSLGYTYAAGTGAAQIPAHLFHATYEALGAPGANQVIQIFDAGQARTFGAHAVSVSNVVGGMYTVPALEGLLIVLSAAGAANIQLVSFIDNVLSKGVNSYV